MNCSTIIMIKKSMKIKRGIEMDNFKDKEQALQMIIDRTGDLGGGDSLAEKLQRLLDLPCEICNDGEIVAEQRQKIERLETLLRNAVLEFEGQICGQSIIGTDLEGAIGITQEEYDELMGNEVRSC